MRIALCVLALGMASGSAAAQGLRRDDPATVLREFLTALSDARWTDAARHVSIDAIEIQRRDLIRSLRRPPRAQTVEDYLRSDPSMPRAVAEYYLKRAAETRPDDWALHHTFANVEDTAALKRLSSLQVAERYLEAHDRRYQLRLSYRTVPGCAGLVPPDSFIQEFRPEYEVLGAIERGDTAWVMHRETMAGAAGYVMPPRIATLFRTSNGWKLDHGRGSLVDGTMGFAADCTPADSSARDTTTRRRP